MKKKCFVKDIREKAPVEGAFLVSKKETGMSKSGKPYLIVRVMDSTGECEARVWDNATELSENFDKNDVVQLRGFVVPYQGKLQINITDAVRLGDGEYDITDFLPASPRDLDEMMAEFGRVLESVEDKFVSALLGSIFSDPDVRRRFRIAPAAKAMHHPYIGGLLEHVLSICGLVDRVVDHYRGQGVEINRDLLVAGAILHDVGKIYELSYATSFDYTDEGRLIGHITMGVELVDGHIRKVEGFPANLAMLLKHMLLSHHGTYEFGSPKRPKTVEAIVLSYLDDLDAKVNAVRSAVESESEAPGNWTSYQRIFERFIYKAPTVPGYEEDEAAHGSPAGGRGTDDGGPGPGGRGDDSPEGGPSGGPSRDGSPGKSTGKSQEKSRDSDDDGTMSLFK